MIACVSCGLVIRVSQAPWTTEEDSKLIALAAEYHVDSIDWHTIAESFGPERW